MTKTRDVVSSLSRLSRDVFAKVEVLGRILRTFFRVTDYKRWRRNVGQIPRWDERNIIIAGMIPEKKTVLDIGSGAQTLRKYLKAGCVYQPCDMVQFSDNILLCDFNRGIYPIVQEKYDYVVCSGVLEYIKHPEDFLSRISCYGDQIILTYAIKLTEESFTARLRDGWINHFSQNELENLFVSLNLGWEYLGRWKVQVIWRVWRTTLEVEE